MAILGNGYGVGVHSGAISAALVLVAGCGRPHMAVPTDFVDDRIEFETVGRAGDDSEGEDALFEFGPFKVSGVKRNLTIDDGFENLEAFEPAKQRGFRFKLAGGGKTTLEGQCSERAPRRTKDLDGSITVEQDAPSLACTCKSSGTAVTQLFVEDLAGQYGGPLIIGDVGARVVGGYKLDSGERLQGRPAGFRVEEPDGTVAAAGILPGEAHVWLSTRLDKVDRQRIACALAGLMLWVPPPVSEDPDED